MTTSKPSLPDDSSLTRIAFGFVLLWSTGYIVGRLAMPYAPPLTFLAWRYGFAIGLLVLALAWEARHKGVAALAWPNSWAACGHIAFSGVLVHALYLGCVWVSVKHGLPAGLSALIVNMQPLLVAVLSPWLGEKVERRQVLALLIGFGGVVMTVEQKLHLGEANALTISLSIVGLLAITAGTLWQRRFCPKFDLRVGTLIQYTASWLLTAPLCYWLEAAEPMVWNGPTISAMLWSVFLLSFAAVFLMFRLIVRGAAARVFAYFYLVPPVTALIAWIGFDERLSPLAMTGFGLVALGVALATRRPA